MRTRAKKYLDSEVSTFGFMKSNRPNGKITVSAFAEMIRNGEYQREIEKLRGGTSEVKKKLPVISPSGTCIKRKLENHIGLVQLDFDCVSDPTGLRESLFAHEHVLLAFVSPSGNGVKALASINPLKHEEAIRKAQEHFRKAYPNSKLDTKPMSRNALMIFSWDSNIKVKDPNSSLKVFDGEPDLTDLGSVSDTVLQSQKTDTDTDSSETDTVPMPMPYADKAANPFVEAGKRLKLLTACEAKKPRILSKYPEDLRKLWKVHIERGLEVDFAKRNETLVNLVARCFYRMGKDQVMQLSQAFYQIYKPFFRDPLENHIHETEAMWKGMENSYLKENAEEKAFYLSLKPELRDGYRICRELACHEEKFKKPYFALSGKEIGKRLGIPRSKGADRLDMLASSRIIILSEKGEAWTTGKSTKANVWEWLLPL
ncbi:hypothetical protein OAK38_04840 [Verrucomicrobia bacterium]|nr:hypothetical protein [Verrucomicrobiota bacterium]